MTPPERLQDVTLAERLLALDDVLRVARVGCACNANGAAVPILGKLERARATIREAAAALSVRGWHDIASAPKDGTRVMLGNAHGAWMAEYRPVYPSGYRPDNPWQSVMLNHDHIDATTRYLPATHWQPLPATPPSEG